MPINIGTIDRLLRFIAGSFIISLYFWGPKTPWAFLGAVPLLTSFLSFCPIYTLFGLNTCPHKNKASKDA